MKKLFLFALLSYFASFAFAQEVSGPWKKIEKNTNPYLQQMQVIGEEDWYQIDNNSIIAFRNKKDVKKQETPETLKKGWRCSGTLIGPYTVLTAAHCLMDEEGKSKNMPQNQVAYPGGTDSGQEIVSINRVAFFPKGYKDNIRNKKRRSYDYAVVVLEKPIGNQLGYFKVSAAPSFKAGDKIEVVGFPAAQPHDHPLLSPGNAKEYSASENIIYHTADTLAGNSGSAIFMKGSKNIVAIHVAHPNGDNSFNIATSFSQKMAETINKYKLAEPNKNDAPNAPDNKPDKRDPKGEDVKRKLNDILKK